MVIYYFGTYGIEFFDNKKDSVLKIGLTHTEKKEFLLSDNTFFIGGKAIGKETNKYIDCFECKFFKVPKDTNEEDDIYWDKIISLLSN